MEIDGTRLALCANCRGNLEQWGDLKLGRNADPYCSQLCLSVAENSDSCLPSHLDDGLTPRYAQKPTIIPKREQVGGNHYKKYAIEPIDFVHKNNLSYIQGNVIKYIVRYKDKNGLEDLKKAKHYIDLLMENEYGEVDNTSLRN